MPNIQLNDRVKFKAPITEVLGILKDTNDTPYLKGEYIGYFVNRLAKRFLADPEYVRETFNSAFFNETKKKTLANAADSIAALINRSDPIASANELYYAVTAVLSGFSGLADGFSPLAYGMRAYVVGIVEKVLTSIDTVNNGSQRDMTMAFRRHLVIRGVLRDVVGTFDNLRLSKEYNAGHDDAIWTSDGQLLLPTTTAALAEAN